MKRISLNRIRPERSLKRNLYLGKGKAVQLEFTLAPEFKAFLKDLAKSKKYSLSLLLNLILTGQEKAIEITEEL